MSTAGLDPLRRLHTLKLSHNQLVKCDGLDCVVTLQNLDVSHNYLQTLSDLSRLCLLTQLDVSANNLQEVSFIVTVAVAVVYFMDMSLVEALLVMHFVQ